MGEDKMPSCLRTTVEVYKLAMSLKFEELKESMMDAIYDYAPQATIPTADAVLEVARAVYGMPTQPDGPLRDFAIGFMKRIGGIAVTTALKDPRLSQLRSSSMPFKADLNRAAHELGPTAISGADVALYSASAACRGISPARVMASSYTVNSPPTVAQNPPVQVAATATQVPQPFMNSVPYSRLPYRTPVTPINPMRFAPPQLAWPAPAMEFLHPGLAPTDDYMGSRGGPHFHRQCWE
jgi:hypothetical protein